MCTIEDFRELSLTEKHRATVESELDMWHRDYLPVGPTVLDVGAGCGETALFYLKHGAKRVVCIEGDEKALELLERNFGHDSRVTIVPVMIDSIKVDIEGHEENLVVESHFPPQFQALEKLDENVTLWKLRRTSPSRLTHLEWQSRRTLHKIRIKAAHSARLMINRVRPREPKTP
jgi:tRNA G37 N-methylase Trm5